MIQKPDLGWEKRILFVVVACPMVLMFCPGQDSLAQPPKAASPKHIQLEFPTLGSSQYWSDVHVCGGWKIQRNAVRERYRLIDSSDVRRAAGDLAECQHVLRHNLADGRVKPFKGKVVILLHGLMRSSDSMDALGRYLHQQGGYEIINLAYASSLASIDAHAEDLKKVMDGLDSEITEINFVAHSLGNIVVRRYLKICEPLPDPRFRRMVMLAPPNQGSSRARALGRSTSLFETIAGPSGQQLGVQWKQLAPKLATPAFEFGIIIGANQDASEAAQDDPYLPADQLLAPTSNVDLTMLQPHDFTVSVDEAQLPGARGFIVGPFFHWDVKHHPTAMKQTLYFLKHGEFDRRIPETREYRPGQHPSQPR
jgi:pimeloyl-ACP methyl ester carboxylesterase